MSSKQKLKTVFLRKRKTLTDQEFIQRNDRILSLLKGLSALEACQRIHVFLPIAKNREVDTWPIIEHLLSIDKEIIISKTNQEDGSLDHFVFENSDQLELSAWGIPEPKNGRQVASDLIDLVITPMIVFDRLGHRIGYGKGYYDRFLSTCRTDCIKVGLSLLPPLDFIPYMDHHDVALDYCITHLGVYDFKS